MKNSNLLSRRNFLAGSAGCAFSFSLAKSLPAPSGNAREVRRMYGLTQNAPARRMNVPRAYISKVEMSRTVPTIATLYDIAGALGIEVRHLLCDTRIHPCELEAISRNVDFSVIREGAGFCGCLRQASM